MTVGKRNRIIEIIAGILLIVFTLDSTYKTLGLYMPNYSFASMSGMSGEMKSMLLTFALGSLFFVFVGAMMIFRAYRRTPMKIAYCITGLAAFLSSSGVLLIISYFGKGSSGFSGSVPLSLIIKYICVSLITGAEIVVGFLTINRNIIWKSRKSLMIYAYILMAVRIVVGGFDWMSAIVILLPFFMQEYTEEKDKKGFVGGISLITGIVLPMALFYVYRRFFWVSYTSSSNGKLTFLDYLSRSDDGYYIVKTAVNLLMYVLLLIAPLLIFERKCSEAEIAAAEKDAEVKVAVIDDTDASAAKTEVFDKDDDNN